MVHDAHVVKIIDPLDVIHGISLDRLMTQLDGSNLDPAEVGRQGCKENVIPSLSEASSRHQVVTRPSITPAFLSGLNNQLERVSHFSG